MRIVGHGIDLVSVARIRAMIDDHGDRFLTRCFTQHERDYSRDSRREAEHLAARFAAKEAGMKALGTGLADGVSWTDFEVQSQPDGSPLLRVCGRAAILAAERGIARWWVSLSHTDELAIASVIAEGATAPA